MWRSKIAQKDNIFFVCKFSKSIEIKLKLNFMYNKEKTSVFYYLQRIKKKDNICGTILMFSCERFGFH